MSGKPAKVKLCAQCRVEGPWRYDEDGNSLGKHDCAEVVADPNVERDGAIKAASDAHPKAKHAALLIITDAARRNEVVTANLVRIEMEMAEVPGPVVGAAFGQAARDGLIRRDGYVPSTQASTHGHPVAQWRSLIYRRGAA